MTDESKANVEANASTKENDQEVKKKRNKKGEKPVEELVKYADDNEIYPRKYDDISRLKFWEHIILHPFKPKMPSRFVGWTEKSVKDDYELEIVNFRKKHVNIVNFVKSHHWDELYLLLFGVFLILCGAHYDGFADKYYIVDPSFLMFPLLLMFFVQLIPTIGSIIIISNFNDLTKFSARRDFGYWAFNAVIIAQYIEYTYYSGHHREHLAGVCRIDPHAEPDRTVCQALVGLFKPKRRHQHHSRVHSPDQLSSHDKSFNDDVSVMSMEEGVALATREDEARGGGDQGGGLDDRSVHSASTGDEGGGGSKDGSKAIGDDNSVATNESLVLASGGFMKRLEEEEAAAEAERLRVAAADKARREALVKDWFEWKCIVCGKQNRRPRHPPVNFNPAFSEKGEFYKRTVVTLVKERDMPVCPFCHTVADFTPRVCTAHIFPHNPNPHTAFENYPQTVPTLPRGFFRKYYDTTTSFLFGVRNHPDSKLMRNDWRLSIYLSSRFPIVPRPPKPASQLLAIGEIVECSKHKVDWTRARVTESRESRIYDIVYDSGDELRMVEERYLRLPAQKGSYAYVTELVLAMLVLFFPLSVAGSFLMSPSAFFLPPLAAGVFLLYIRVDAFLDSFHEHMVAGCCLIFQHNLIFTAPLVLLVASGAMGLAQPFLGLPWVMVVICLIAAKFCSLLIMYLKRPTFAVMALVLFLQTSACLFMLALRLDGMVLWRYISIDLAPAFTSLYTLLRYRRWLGYVWDVSLKIRPALYADYEISHVARAYLHVKQFFSRLFGRAGAPIAPSSTVAAGDVTAAESAENGVAGGTKESKGATTN